MKQHSGDVRYIQYVKEVDDEESGYDVLYSSLGQHTAAVKVVVASKEHNEDLSGSHEKSPQIDKTE